jgi:hypothetical protein
MLNAGQPRCWCCTSTMTTTTMPDSSRAPTHADLAILQPRHMGCDRASSDGICRESGSTTDATTAAAAPTDRAPTHADLAKIIEPMHMDCDWASSGGSCRESDSMQLTANPPDLAALPHVKQAWEWFRRHGSPQWWAAPLVGLSDPVGRTPHKCAHTLHMPSEQTGICASLTCSAQQHTTVVATLQCCDADLGGLTASYICTPHFLSALTFLLVDQAFRLLCRRHGAGMAHTEMADPAGFARSAEYVARAHAHVCNL